MATGGTDPWALLLAPAGLATVLGIRRSLRKARPGTFAAVLAGGMTFIAVFASLHTMPRIYEKISMRPEGLAAAGLVRQAQRVILLGGEKRSLLVYAGRPDGVCAALGRVQALVRQLRAGPAALLLAQPERLEALKASSDQIEYSQPIQLSPRATLVYTRPILRPTSRTVSGSAPAGGGSPPPG
jgi:hypothetical protein